MKTKFFTLLFAIMASTSELFAVSGTCGENASWTLDTSTGELVISGTGNMYYYGSGTPYGTYSPWYSYRNSITSVVVSDGITSIGDNAFRLCGNIVSVTMPDGLTRIGQRAFEDCGKLASVTIPNSVTSIKDYAFYRCYKLASITLPNNIQSIERNVFDWCSSLTSITIPNSVTSIGYRAFDNCSLTSITIPSNVESIGNEAFSGCKRLKSVIIPDNVTSLGEGAFYSCDSLTSVILSNNITSIQRSTFSTCPRLTSITIPNNITSIGQSAFYGCSGLTSVAIPNTVTSIGGSAFYGCTGLISIEIPDNIASIEYYTFRNCSTLTSVAIPSNVTSIGESAFEGCSGLTSITCFATTPPSLSAGVFNGVNNSTPLYVPQNSLSTYQNNENWTQFFSTIKPFYYGTCGDNLNWNIVEGILTISGTGTMYDYDDEEDYAPWRNCQITTAYLLEGVTSIGEYAFANKLITAIYIPSSITSISYAFYNSTISELHISDLSAWCNITTNTSISCPHSLYLNDTEIKDLIIPNNVTTIRYGAFSNCTGLTSVTIPGSVSSIGMAAFYDCGGLTSITIEDGVVHIGQSAFSGCYRLNPIVIPNSVTSIGNNAFYNCRGLKSVTLGNHVTSIGDRAFYNCDYMTSINIPNSVTSIGDEVFNKCYKLPVIDNLRYADTYLVSAINNLPSYTIKSGTRFVGYEAFKNCTNLTSITLPDSVTSIGGAAFYNCNSLISITNYATTPQTISYDVFNGVNKSTCTLYVPKESVDIYKGSMRWKDFENIIKIPLPTWNVIFLDYDDNVLSEQEVEEGSAATPPANPSREGYTFTGWDRDFSNVTEDITVQAQYSINHYQVDFLDWNGSLLKSDDVEYGSAATPPANPSRDWYTFTGWDKDFSNITSNLVVTAQYEEGQTRDNTIFFINGTDDSEISHQAIEIDFPTPPTIAGFTFLKWQFMAGEIEDGIQIQAVYESDAPTSAPEVVTNPSNPSQKLIRNGNIYILTDSKTYTVTGQEVR